MGKKTADIVAYITIIGWIVAFIAGDRRKSAFHLNQGLVIGLVGLVWSIADSIVAFILFSPLTAVWSVISALVSLCILILIIIGIVNAVQGKEKPLPFIGEITLYK